jgi:hypothetical protein
VIDSQASDSDTNPALGVRRILLFTLVLGMTGTGAELLLIGHTQGVWQLIPLCLLGLGLFAVLFHLVRPSRAAIRLLQAVGYVFLASGALGFYLHYGGNIEWLEEEPDLEGFELFQQAMAGTLPVLAPGGMALLGLIGIAFSYRHPNAMRVG